MNGMVHLWEEGCAGVGWHQERPSRQRAPLLRAVAPLPSTAPDLPHPKLRWENPSTRSHRPDHRATYQLYVPKGPSH